MTHSGSGPRAGDEDHGSAYSGADHLAGHASSDCHEAAADGHDHGHGGHAGHGHGVSADADRRYLTVALVLIVGFMAVEIVVAVLAHSLVLLADAGHMLTDAGALGGAMWAAALAARPARGHWTFGFKPAEIVSAALNGIMLLVVAVLVGFEALRRLADPPAVAGGAVTAVAALGVAVDVLATWVLAKANRSSLNIEGAFQHLLTDTYAFLATLVAGMVIVTTEFLQADAIASLIVVALMLRAAWQLLRASGRVLLEAAPEGVDLPDVRAHLLQAPHVLEVHDLHAWVVTSDLPALSAHIVLDDSCFTDGHAPQVLDHFQHCLVGHFDVEHSTFQLEPVSHASHEAGSHA